ncbi:MAG: guanine deaminase [Methyloligellaceae bacterium]
MTKSTENSFALRGQTLSFTDDPFAVGIDRAVSFNASGAVVIDDGTIIDVGPADTVLDKYPGIEIVDHGEHLIMSGFVDCHVHYPQSEIIGSYGEQLLEWLTKYTFPAEGEFSDKSHARSVARFFLDELLRNGTTTASVYCTVHPQSAEIFFEEAERRDMRMAAGKVMMDSHAPSNVLDSVQSSYDDSQALIGRWHGNGRLHYVISPRFALTSSPEQLEAAGTLWKKNPGTLMQTHLSENLAEIDRARELYQTAEDYLGIYEQFGLVGPGANFGHAIHLKQREIELFRSSGSGISHCPTSNMFIGSGLFDMAGLRENETPVSIGMGTDIGGGSSFSMFQTMKSSYEICQLNGYSLHPIKAFYLATVGSATVMGLEHKIGNLSAGHDADVIVIDLKSKPVIERRMRHAADLTEALFTQIILADDRAINATYVSGKLLYNNGDK